MRVSRPLMLLVVLLCIGHDAEAASAPARPTAFHDVDPFLGVDAGGNTTPGAQVPFGFVSLQPDMDHPNTSGYRTGDPVAGFSHTHVSGTGGASKYGNLRVMPTLGSVHEPVPQPGSDEVAWPGYYAVTLGAPNAAIRAEMTATRLVGFHRYTFPRTKDAQVLIDISSVINLPGLFPQHATACRATVSGPASLEGTCSYRGGWNPGAYTLHFAARFDRSPSLLGVGSGAQLGGRSRSVRMAGKGRTAWAWASFDTTGDPILGMKLALSFISTKKAEANLAAVAAWNFDRALIEAQQQWSAALGTISVSGGTPTEREIFSSSLYRAQVMPHDVSGENGWWSSSEPHYEDFYTLWDTFRTQMPLLTIIQPARERDMVRSLVDTFRHTGWLPDARIAGCNGLTQGGSNGDVLIADAIVKGVRGIDYETALQALVKDANTDSPQPYLVGREAMSTYQRLGYLPLEVARSGSRTMEYSYDDFAIAQVAQALGKPALATEYRERSLFWAHLWDARSQSIHPRHTDGSWQQPFDRREVTMSWLAPFYEGTPWQYSTFVPHDVQGLINRLGGDDAFVDWLDRFFAQGEYNPANEPDLLAPWLYVFAGRPDRTQALVRALEARYYKSGRGGLPGNDDAGAMTSWYVWSAIGLFPNAGQDYYFIGSPLFTEIRIDVGAGRTFVITALNAGSENPYIQSAMLNGRPLARAWLTHQELVAGGQLRLELGPRPSRWGAAAKPYSVEHRDAPMS